MFHAHSIHASRPFPFPFPSPFLSPFFPLLPTSCHSPQHGVLRSALTPDQVACCIGFRGCYPRDRVPDTVCIFFIIYIILLGYLLTTFIYNLEFLCHWHMAFRGSWLLKTSDSIIVDFLIWFSFVLLYASSYVHVVALVPCLCISFDILVLKESYEELIINVMTKKLDPPYPTVSLSLQGDTASLYYR